MYIPPHFAETRTDNLHRVMRAHPLGTLVTQGPAGLDANHLPFEFDPATGEHGTLLAHVARANPLWQICETGSRVLVIFHGASAYVSPNWYPSKHASHQQVPTWNYEVVHAHGVLTVHDDERFVRRVVALLTRRHEAGEPLPWKMGDSAPEFIADRLRQIVGIEITITSLVGKAKLSQNRDARDQASAAEMLRERGHGELAERMRPSDTPSS